MEAMAAKAPAHMTAELFLPVFKRQIESVVAGVEKLFKKAAAETRGRSQEEKQGYLGFLMQREMPSIQSESMEETGMSPEDFQCCAIKFGQEPGFGAVVRGIQERQEAMHRALLSSK
jgi:hypothetical protein